MPSDIVSTLALFSTFVIFILGMKYQNWKTKKDNIRDKAKSINESTIPALKNKIVGHGEYIFGHYLDGGTYIIEISKTQPKPILQINSDIFIHIAKSFDIFKVVNEEILLIYTKDKHLKKHMNIVLGYLNDYHVNVCKLKKHVESLSNFEPDNEFKQALKELCINEFGEEITNEFRPDDLDFLALYVLALTGSNNNYNRGDGHVMGLLERRFDDLQSILKSQDAILFNEIQTIVDDIKSDLRYALEEIQKLQETWQEKLII
jgi:hypothetical protein